MFVYLMKELLHKFAFQGIFFFCFMIVNKVAGKTKAWWNHYEIDRCLLKVRYKYYEITL